MLCHFAETAAEVCFCSCASLASQHSTSFERMYSEYTASPTKASVTGLNCRAASSLIFANKLYKVI